MSEGGGEGAKEGEDVRRPFVLSAVRLEVGFVVAEGDIESDTEADGEAVAVRDGVKVGG
ncbi:MULTISPECIES: hypothetical protein [unclassified Streptomyces]|uniref:hypothetical protein n=1 Tax=unclassified Streptomyces TaxID=2593676 RepID=UPI0036D1DC98